MAIKWDSSSIVVNEHGQRQRVRELMFQDHVSAQELTDIDGKVMFFHEVGSRRKLAEAKRNGREWVCTRYGAPNKYYFAPNKDLAVDFMLGREVPTNTL